MAIASFAPASSAFLSAGNVSSNADIPSGGSILAVTNTGICMASVEIGTSSSLAVVFGGGLAIQPGATEYLTIGSNTTIAAVTAFAQVGLNLVSGN